MKDHDAARQVQDTGATAEGAFRISREHETHIMRILRDTLYSDKITAPMREYAANAWDAHREVGKGDVPIKVHIPTDLQPNLNIRDFGPGLSDEALLMHYTQYGDSSKRNADDAVGMLGIGCLLKGQPIVTVEGMKPIEEIREGDLVLTHKGRFRQVTRIMQRSYKGRAYKVYLSQGGKPLVLTEEHPILVSDGQGNVNWMLPEDIKTGYRGKTKGVRFWSSYAVLPATLEETGIHLPILEFLDGGYSFEGGTCTRRKVLCNSRPGVPHQRKSTRTTRWERFPEKLFLDFELGWLLGLFAAEGSATQKQITISLSIDETELADRFTAGMQSKFGVAFKAYPRPERNLLELVAQHTALALLLKNLCGSGAKNKRVPYPVMQGPQDFRKGFLRGVFDGDGSPTRPRFIFGVASPKLAWGVRTLMAITEDKWGTVGTMEDYPGRWCINYNREASWGYSFRQGDYLLRPIKRTETFELDTEVFNFSVKEDESYVSDFILHNCKSAFCYADTFTVTSWHAGMKSVFIAVLDETDNGTMKKFYEEPCGDETGLEIQIPVHRKDVYEFQSKASKLFRYWTPRPDINIQIEPEIHTDLLHGYVAESGGAGQWIAVMGCVPYRLDIEQVHQQLESIALWEAASLLSGGLFFDIGGVQISASREDLKYGDRTKTAIVECFSQLFHEYTAEVVRSLDDPSVSDWEKRLRARNLSGRVNGIRAALPGQYKSYLEREVAVDSHEAFVLTYHEWHKKHVSYRLIIDPRTVIYFKDDNRSIKGYNVPSGTYVLRPVGGVKVSRETAMRHVEKSLTESGLMGIPIRNISSIPYDETLVKNSLYGKNGQRKTKYGVACFQLNMHGKEYPSNPLSDNWDVIERVPTNDDVFVILSAFLPYNQFFDLYQKDLRLMKFLGREMPPVYGYKTKQTKPVTEQDCSGVEYRKWRETSFKDILTHKVKLAIREMQWAEALRYSTYYSFSDGLKSLSREAFTELLGEVLGKKHPFAKFFRKHVKALAAFNAKTDDTRFLLRDIVNRYNVPDPIKDHLKDLTACYPLLKDIGLENLWKNHRDHWIDYVKMVDANVGLVPASDWLND